MLPPGSALDDADADGRSVLLWKIVEVERPEGPITTVCVLWSLTIVSVLEKPFVGSPASADDTDAADAALAEAAEAEEDMEAMTESA
jgi:hypothetical protein